MNADSPTQPRPLIPLVLLHMAAASVCFGFFTVMPIGVCLVCMAIGNDMGGPMFFPMFIMGVIVFAAVITIILGGAALLSDLLRRRYRVSLWLPPLTMFALITGSCWLIAPEVHPAVAPIIGCIVALAFVIHWAAISTVWFLPRLLFRLFGVSNAPPKI